MRTTTRTLFRSCCAVVQRRSLVGMLCVGGAFLSLQAQHDVRKITGLECDALTDPLGIDTPHPLLRWKVQDGQDGARQTAYEIGVFSRKPTVANTKPDVWDSGQIKSDVTTGVAYAGPELAPSHRYFWRVQVWDASGKPYAMSETAHWETGLLQGAAWKGQWIGYEAEELHRVRASGAAWVTNSAESKGEPKDTQHDFRLAFALGKPVKTVSLYTTGEDTAAAWVNNTPVLAAKPLPPWQQMPWGTYDRVDVTKAVRQGSNVLAIGVTRYKLPRQTEAATEAPMSAVLYVVYGDGSTELFKSKEGAWKAALDAPEGWWHADFDDHAWKTAKLYTPASDPFGSRDEGLPWPTGPAAALRKEFVVKPQTLVSARLYATALGAYKFSLNGASVGDQILAPGWMDFREHIAYQTYDVTQQVRHGSNVVAAYLAPGWYSTPLRWFRQGNNYGGTQPALKAQLRFEYSDGKVEWVSTDATWKANTSPITFAELYDGETRDARLEEPGWNKPGFRDTAWHAAMTVAPEKEPRIVSQYFQPIRAERVMTAKTITEPKRGVYVLDFGQNMSALPRLQVRGSAGDNVQLRFAEVLNADGTLYTDNLRTAKVTDHFILAGGGAEAYEPTFTFHGFRYAEITGVRQKPTLGALKAVVLHTDAPFTVRFSTGDTMVNQLWSNVLWGQRSNFVGTPTDCPQRDERLGWSADAQVFWRTASYNMDLTAFSQKYAADLHGTQVGTAMYGIYAPGVDTPNPGFGAAWSDAGVIVPWTGWIQSGNTRIVDENWDGMQRYLAEIEQKNPDYLWRNGFGAAFGDWLTPTITTPEDLLATAYWAYDAGLMRQMALATGRTADAERYAGMFDKIKAAFQKAYIRNDGFVGTVERYPSIPPPTVNPVDAAQSKTEPVETQTGYVLALYMGLMPEPLRAAAAQRLVDKIRANRGLLGTGFLGTPYLLAVLADTGHSDMAYQLLLNRDYPSWGYLIDHGATTTWERWNGDQMRSDPSMNSYNHYAYGAVAEWMYRYAAGVDTMPEGAGFHRLYLHPNFDPRLRHLALDYDSVSGTVHSEWLVEGTNVRWDVVVPPNTTALLSTRSTNAMEFKLDGGSLLSSTRVQPGSHDGEFDLPAGRYRFTAVLQPATTERADASR